MALNLMDSRAREMRDSGVGTNGRASLLASGRRLRSSEAQLWQQGKHIADSAEEGTGHGGRSIAATASRWRGGKRAAAMLPDGPWGAE